MEEAYLEYIDGAVSVDRDWVDRDSLIPFRDEFNVRMRLFYYDRSSRMGQLHGNGRSEVVLMICCMNGKTLSMITCCSSGPTEFFNPRETEDEDERRHSWQDMIFNGLQLDYENELTPTGYEMMSWLVDLSGDDFTREEMGTRAYIGVKQSNGDVKVAVVNYDGLWLEDILKEHHNSEDRANKLAKTGEIRSLSEDGTLDTYDDAFEPQDMSLRRFNDLRDASCSYLWSDGKWTMKRFL